MSQCSNSSSICLTTFLLEAAAAVSVETLFPKNLIAGLLGQATLGCLARAAAVLGCFSVRRYTVLGYRRRVKGGEGEGAETWSKPP